MEERLSRIEEKIDYLIKQDADRRVSIARLEVKSGFWGLVGGALVALLAFLKKDL